MEIVWIGEVALEGVEEEEVEDPRLHLHLYLCRVQMAEVEVGSPQSSVEQVAEGEELGWRSGEEMPSMMAVT